MALSDLIKDYDPDEDAFVRAERVTPDELRRVADDWDRMAPIITKEFTQQRKREGDELRQQLEAAAAVGDENKLSQLRRVRARWVLGIVTVREVHTEIARQLGSGEGYTDPMRCALELMI